MSRRALKSHRTSDSADALEGDSHPGDGPRPAHAGKATPARRVRWQAVQGSSSSSSSDSEDADASGHSADSHKQTADQPAAARQPMANDILSGQSS